MDPNTELSIDVGGGSGERYEKLARKNPGKTYLVLDPSIKNIPNKPENLHLVEWKSDMVSSIPLPDNSVSDASIAFLMGEIRSVKKHEDASLEADKEKYRKIVSDTKRVLKNNGTIEIADVKANIFYIVDILKNEGFIIDKEPQKLEDENYSVWANIFTRVFKKGNKSEEESVALPMLVRARKK